MAECYTLETLGELSGVPRLFAVLGNPIAHSLSPQLHRPALKACEIEGDYVRIQIEPERMPELVQRFRTMPMGGWNCTVPHKQTMFQLVDELDETARRFQAVNTVLPDEGRLVGFNTDGIGWVRAIREEFRVDVGELRIMILGAGGAGRALAIQAALEGCDRLVIANRTEATAKALAKETAPLFRAGFDFASPSRVKSIPMDPEVIAKELLEIDLLVNTTSVGLKSEEPPLLTARQIPEHLMVYDTIYRPARTALIQEAEKAGAKTANGLSMLLHQGAESFQIWTGRAAPLDLMRQSLVQAAKEFR